MKRTIIIILFVLIKWNVFTQSFEESWNSLSIIDIEHSQLYNELLEIIKREFAKPINDEELVFVYDEYYGYGLHNDPFTGRIAFIHTSYLKCGYGEPIYSITSGIIKDIIFDRMVIIEFNDIEIFYRDLDVNTEISIGDLINTGQLLGTVKGVDAFHNYFEGILIKIKYKDLYFDMGHIFKTISIIGE